MATPLVHLDQEQYERLRVQGLSGREIAQEMGHAESTLRRLVKRLGLPPADAAPKRPRKAHGIARVTPGSLPEEWQALFPVLEEVARWWTQRRQQLQAPDEQFKRATFHVRTGWVAKIREEADQTGETLATVLDRALRQYFQGRVT